MITLKRQGDGFIRVVGNPTIKSIIEVDLGEGNFGVIQCSLESLLRSSYSPEYCATTFGIFRVSTTPPEGYQWLGQIDDVDGWPQLVFVPIPPLPLEEYHKQIKQIRDELIVSGGYKAQGTWFHSDLTSRSQQLGLLRIADQMMSEGAQPTDPFITPSGPLMWKGMGGDFVTMTPSLAYDIFAAATMQDQALHAYGEYLINLINEADDPSDVDIHSGWPETFHSQS